VLTGSFVSTVCYAVTIRAKLGLGPLYALQDGVARRLGIEIGQSVMLVGVALFVGACALRWRPGPFTLALPFIGGATLDALLPHVGAIHGVWLQLFAVTAASWIMGFGGALMIAAAIGCAPYDGVMLALHRITGFANAPIRLAMELTALVVGWSLGGAVGVGTVITGILIGPALQFWLRVVGPVGAPAATPASARAEVATSVSD